MRRGGYTLLEVVLAIAIGLLIVAALYVALDTQFRYMASGRNAIAEGQLARGLLNRIAADIRQSLAVLPKSPTGGAPAAGASTGSADAATSSTGTAGESSTSPGQSGSTTGQANLGLTGDETQLTLYVSAVPRIGREDAEAQNGQSDQRRISYTIIPGAGLARQEVRAVTADDTLGADAPVSILAAEVVELRFRYYDPAAGDWVTTWDGTTTGPPLAVEVTLGIQQPDEGLDPGQTTRNIRYHRLVVAIPAAAVSQEQVDQQTGAGP
jgi:prepilin-type N-terminal cleavage/methylation domain-containing protein